MVLITRRRLVAAGGTLAAGLGGRKSGATRLPGNPTTDEARKSDHVSGQQQCSQAIIAVSRNAIALILQLFGTNPR
jgi:hypothetical protein